MAGFSNAMPKGPRKNFRGHGNCSGLGNLSRHAGGMLLGQLPLVLRACYLAAFGHEKGGPRGSGQSCLDAVTEKLPEFQCEDTFISNFYPLYLKLHF